MSRRTIRRYAHELFPHPTDEYEVRPLAVEVPYLYALAIGFDVQGTSWIDAPLGDEWGREVTGGRILILIEARHKALLADALLQGMAGDEAWAWAESRMDEEGSWVYDRAVHYGVDPHAIKSYPCGPEPDHHDHMESTGDATGHGVITRVTGPESTCPTCTEEAGDSRG